MCKAGGLTVQVYSYINKVSTCSNTSNNPMLWKPLKAITYEWAQQIYFLPLAPNLIHVYSNIKAKLKMKCERSPEE